MNYILVKTARLIDGVKLCKELEEYENVECAILVGDRTTYVLTPEDNEWARFVGEFYSTPQAVARFHKAATD